MQIYNNYFIKNLKYTIIFQRKYKFNNFTNRQKYSKKQILTFTPIIMFYRNTFISCLIHPNSQTISKVHNPLPNVMIQKAPHIHRLYGGDISDLLCFLSYFPDEACELSRQSATFRFRAMPSTQLPVSHDSQA